MAPRPPYAPEVPESPPIIVGAEPHDAPADDSGVMAPTVGDDSSEVAQVTNVYGADLGDVEWPVGMMAPTTATGTANVTGTAFVTEVYAELDATTGFSGVMAPTVGDDSSSSSSEIVVVAGADTGVMAPTTAVGGVHVQTYGEHPEEFCQVVPTLDVDGEVVQYSTVAGHPGKLLGDGSRIYPEFAYDLVARTGTTGDDSYDEEVVTVRPTGAVQEQRIGFSARMSMPCGWSTYVDALGYEVEWLKGDNGGYLLPNERWEEDWPYGENGLIHNPTFGGQWSQWASEQANWPRLNSFGLYFSPRLMVPEHVAGTDGSVKFHGAVIPLHWDPDGTEPAGFDPGANPIGPAWDHGGAMADPFASPRVPGVPILFWDQRQYFRLEACWRGNADLHRMTTWTFQRSGWAANRRKAGLVGHGLSLIAIFDECWVLDLSTGGELNASAFMGLGTAVFMSTGGSIAQVGWTPPGIRWESFVPSGYGAAVFRRLSDDFCVAYVFKLSVDSDEERRPTTMMMTLETLQRSIAFWAGLGKVAVAGEHEIPGCYVSTISSTHPLLDANGPFTGRADGWIAHSSFVWTGLYANCRARLAEIYASGALDEAPPTDLPDEVLDGTDGISDYYAEAEVTSELIVETGTGASDSDAYCTAAFVGTHLASLGSNSSSWESSTQEQKDAAVRVATNYLDAAYSFRGSRKTQAQALQWPRVSVVDDEGWGVANDSVPLAVQQACAILAGKVRAGITLMPDQSGDGTMSSSSVNIGPISISDQFSSGRSTTARRFVEVDRLIKHLIVSSGTATTTLRRS